MYLSNWLVSECVCVCVYLSICVNLMPLIGTLISHKLSLITAHKPDYNNAREPLRQATRQGCLGARFKSCSIMVAAQKA